MSPSRFLNANEIADLLGCSVRTIRRRIADGSLPSVLIGGLRRVPETALAELYGTHPTDWSALIEVHEGSDTVEDTGTTLCPDPEASQTVSTYSPRQVKTDWAALLEKPSEPAPQPVPTKPTGPRPEPFKRSE